MYIIVHASRRLLRGKLVLAVNEDEMNPGN